MVMATTLLGGALGTENENILDRLHDNNTDGFLQNVFLDNVYFNGLMVESL